jgi:hypothetical protein
LFFAHRLLLLSTEQSANATDDPPPWALAFTAAFAVEDIGGRLALGLLAEPDHLAGPFANALGLLIEPRLSRL